MLKRFLLYLNIFSALAVPSFANEELDSDDLILDLDAALGVKLEDGDRVAAWVNQASEAQEFVKQDVGREGTKLGAGSGRPRWIESDPGIGGLPTLEFLQQELINEDEDAFDHLTTGAGHTWFAVISAGKQGEGLKDVKAFFGNLKNQAKYEGLWGCFKDDSTLWVGARNGESFGRFDENNTQLLGPIFEPERYYLVASRLAAGTGEVVQELFVDSLAPCATATFPVSPNANPSKMAIGQERDATEHPGKESFRGRIARLLIYEKSLSDEELANVFEHLSKVYDLPLSEGKE